MKYIYNINASFVKNLKGKVLSQLKIVDEIFTVSDLSKTCTFYKNFYDYSTYLAVYDVFINLGFHVGRNIGQNYVEASASLEYDDCDRLSAAYLHVDSKTEYDSSRFFYQKDNNNLTVQAKKYENFNSWQISSFDKKHVLIVKQNFIDFFKLNEFKGLDFKPLYEKCVSGEILKVENLYWAIPDLLFNSSDRSKFRCANNWDKFNQTIPNTIMKKVAPELEGVDIFSMYGIRIMISQNFYRALLKEPKLSQDLKVANYWDLGYYGGEASRHLKEQLIKQGSYDNSIKDEY